MVSAAFLLRAMRSTRVREGNDRAWSISAEGSAQTTQAIAITGRSSEARSRRSSRGAPADWQNAKARGSARFGRIAGQGPPVVPTAIDLRSLDHVGEAAGDERVRL